MSGYPRVQPLHPSGLGRHWLNACQSTKTGGPIANLFNVLLALRNDPAWAGMLRFDEMLRSVVAPARPIQDIEVFRIHEWMQTNGLKRVAIEVVREAIEIVGHENPFHPLRDQLEQFADDHDGFFRTADLLPRYLGTDDNDYTRAIGPMFLRAMVARVYEPGCKADYMLVLEGPQGKMKSQACEVLAGEYFSDAMPDLGSDHVRVQMHLRGKWLIEVSELSAFSRAEAAKLKAFLTTKIEPYLPKFARNQVREPRQCLFVGTTNKQAYLRDETGARRFWPVKCGSINLDALKRDRAHLIGEAVLSYRSGAPWWPDPKFEENHIAPVQAARFDGDAWEKAVEEWDGKVWDTDAQTRVDLHPPYYLADIARGALRIPTEKLSKPDEHRLTTVLEILGWSRADKTRKGRPWYPS